MKRLRLPAHKIPTLLIFFVFACGRGGSPKLPPVGFKVEFGEHDIPAEMVVGQKLIAGITVRNISPRTWPSKPNDRGLHAVNLSYHWLDRKGSTVIFEGLRTGLPHDLDPGEAVELKAGIQAPARGDMYTLEVTMVQEGVAWFPEMDGEKLVLPVNVVSAKAEASAAGGNQLRSTVGTPKVASRKEPRPEKAAKSPLDNGSDETLRMQRSQNKPVTAQVDEATKERDQGSHLWSVQIGSYRRENDATNVAKRLSDKGYDAYVVTAQVKGRSWHRVRIGRFPTKAEADKLQNALRAAEGLNESFVTNLK